MDKMTFWYCHWCGDTHADHASVLNPLFCAACTLAFLRQCAESRKASSWLLRQRAAQAQATRFGLTTEVPFHDR